MAQKASLSPKQEHIRSASIVHKRTEFIGGGKSHVVEIFRQHILRLEVHGRNGKGMYIVSVGAIALFPDLPAAFILITGIISVCETACRQEIESPAREGRRITAANTMAPHIVQMPGATFYPVGIGFPEIFTATR